MNFIRLLLALAAGSAIVMADRPNPLTITSSIPGQFQLTWLADNLRPYQMENSPDLGMWTNLGDVVVGTGSTEGMLVTTTEPKYFYRLREGAMRPGFDALAMAPNDDETYAEPVGSIMPVSLGFTVNYYGESYSTCFVNNNGNITSDAAHGTYTPTPLGGTYRKLIAPFWADVDTRGEGSDVVRFSDNSITTATINWRAAFGVTYHNVGYFNFNTDKLNSFQVTIIDRSDIAAGDFDIEFNYNRILWETGEYSGGINGYGGHSARAGVSNTDGSYFEYKGSGQTLAFLDSDIQTGQPNYQNGLIYQSYNSTCPGRIVLPIRGGRVANSFIVNAGEDQTLDETAGSTFQLVGSIDPQDSTGVNFLWSQVSGPQESVFSSASSLITNVTISEPGEYQFKLVAIKLDDPFSITAVDTVQIIHPAAYSVNSGYYELHAPDPLTITLYQAVASGPNGVDFSFQWTQVGGEEAIIFNPTELHPTITLPGPGSYKFLMTATTSQGSPFIFTSYASVYYYEE